jgi:beta-N-acetylhexosaminidase
LEWLFLSLPFGMMFKKINLYTLALLFLSIQTFGDSLDIKIGQMLMVGMSGKSVNQNSPIVRDIKKGFVGGVLLFEYNLNPINTKKNLSQLTDQLQNAATIPLLISIDQEGGQVNRLKTKYGFSPMPSAKSVAEKKSLAYADSISSVIANSLMEVGINLNFAPVADLHFAYCPVLGKRNRCFSSEPEEVMLYDSIYIENHHKLGIKTSLKHFPGHGSSNSDSHLGLTDVSKTWSYEELLPYSGLLSRGMVDMIMTAHIVNRKLDESGLPATLSKKVITGLLREKMKYNGVVISDDMQMHAISNQYTLRESLLKGIQAGVDMFIFSNNISGATQYTPSNVHAVIRKLVEEGLLSERRIHESYDRIMALKRTR